MLSDKELKEKYTIHKEACKQANVKPMSWKKFILNEIYQEKYQRSKDKS